MNHTIRWLAAVLALTALPTGAAPAPPGVDAAFDGLEHEYVVYFLGRFPVVATYLGGSAFDPALAHVDGRLRDHSAAALAAEDARLAAFRSRFEAFDPASLPARQRIDRGVVLAQVDFLIHQHQVLRHQQRSIDSYVDEPFRGVDWQLQGMTPGRNGTLGTPQEWRELVARVRAIPAYMAVARQQLEAGIAAGNYPDWRESRHFGIEASEADASYFARTLPDMARTSLDASAPQDILAGLDDACEAAARAYAGLRDFIAGTFFEAPDGHPGPVARAAFRGDHFALGEQAYDWALRNNLRLGTTASVLYDHALPLVDATRQAMAALAQQIALAHHWRVPKGTAGVQAVLEQLGKDGPASDAQMLAGYRETGVRLVEYARRTDLFDVPADYQLDVLFTPPSLRASIDGAAYYPAPPFKSTGVGRFYVNPTGDDPEQLRQLHNVAARADLAAHEGFPGHDWHYKTMALHREVISPVRWLTPGAVEDSSSMWEDSLASEGWALYAEGLLAEPQGSTPGFYTPEERLYQLQGLLYRNLRVRLDTGLHTGRLSFEDAVTSYSEVVDFLPGSCRGADSQRTAAKRASCEVARSAIGRYARWPTQAITYRLGKDQILELRAKAQARLGHRFSLRRFHEQFMQQGTIPANYFSDELLRVLDEQSPADAQPATR
jgi:uncharacterized protein (DUF885 family)